MAFSAYENLRKKLAENENWPLKYMFKFIVPNHGNKVETIKALLPENGKITYKHTENLKHVSITCVVHMHSPEQITEIMGKASKVEGVLVL